MGSPGSREGTRAPSLGRPCSGSVSHTKSLWSRFDGRGLVTHVRSVIASAEPPVTPVKRGPAESEPGGALSPPEHHFRGTGKDSGMAIHGRLSGSFRQSWLPWVSQQQEVLQLGGPEHPDTSQPCSLVEAARMPMQGTQVPLSAGRGARRGPLCLSVSRGTQAAGLAWTKEVQGWA